MREKKAGGPLDRLTVLTDVQYLSDLRYIDYEIIRKHLHGIEVEKYPLYQWLDAAEYLTGTKPQADTPQQVFNHLRNYRP